MACDRQGVSRACCALRLCALLWQLYEMRMQTDRVQLPVEATVPRKGHLSSLWEHVWHRLLPQFHDNVTKAGGP
jgi:hypothetical protein